MSPSARTSDAFWMRQCLALAALGEGTTRPNPRVGAVVVRDGVPVGWGFHRAAGERHAETQALDQAAGAARGADLFVNLEPCAHQGRTPPCVQAILQAGVRRVVIGTPDLNPQVRGRGIRTLREAGVAVECGVLGSPARWLNRDFLHWAFTGSPWVTLKAAASLDGRLSAAGGRSRWISSSASRRWAHRLRRRHDAVLVGAGTIRADDPRLTVRLHREPGPAPLAVVVSATLDIPAEARVFRADRKVIVIHAAEAPPERRRALEPLAELWRCPDGRGGVDLDEAFRRLGGLGVQSVLVEGGGRTLAGVVDRRLGHEWCLFLAPRMLGGQGATPLLDRPAVASPAEGVELADCTRDALGPDTILHALSREGHEALQALAGWAP